MFELWKEDQSRVRLDANSQTSSFLGSYWIDRTSNWEDQSTSSINGNFPAFYAQLPVHNDTVFVMMGTTDGQVVAIRALLPGNGVKILSLIATGRVGMWFYCFGVRNVTQSNCGLQLLDTDGNVTFDSQAKWLRFAGIIRNPAYNVDYPWPAGVPTVAAGMCQRGQWFRRVLVGQWPSYLILTYGLRISTGLVAQRVVAQQGPLGDVAGRPDLPGGDIFFADVTRY